MDIHQLIEKTGVPRRTIYYYVQIGLLPPPRGKGKTYEYTEEHLERLLLIKKLQKMRYSLKEIKKLFETYPPEAIEEMIEYRLPEREEIVVFSKNVCLAVEPRSRGLARGERWVRFQLAEGVELHIRLPVSKEAKEIIEMYFPQIWRNLTGGDK